MVLLLIKVIEEFILKGNTLVTNIINNIDLKKVNQNIREYVEQTFKDEGTVYNIPWDTKPKQGLDQFRLYMDKVLKGTKKRVIIQKRYWQTD